MYTKSEIYVPMLHLRGKINLCGNVLVLSPMGGILSNASQMKSSSDNVVQRELNAQTELALMQHASVQQSFNFGSYLLILNALPES